MYFAEQGRGYLVGINMMYSVVTILMSWSCGRMTRMMDWRLEALLWCSVPMMIGLVMAVPNWLSVVQSFPAAISKKSRNTVASASGQTCGSLGSREKKRPIFGSGIFGLWLWLLWPDLFCWTTLKRSLFELHVSSCC